MVAFLSVHNYRLKFSTRKAKTEQKYQVIFRPVQFYVLSRPKESCISTSNAPTFELPYPLFPKKRIRSVPFLRLQKLRNTVLAIVFFLQAYPSRLFAALRAVSNRCRNYNCLDILYSRVFREVIPNPFPKFLPIKIIFSSNFCITC